MKKLLLLCSLTLVFSCFSACSFGGKKGTPEARQALVFVSQQYIGAIVGNHYDHVQAMILWGDYNKAKGSSGSKEIVKIQMEKLAEKFPVANRGHHPLLNLDLDYLEVDGDDAEIVFFKTDNKQQQKVEISLQWVGRGWLVVDDSIFGKNGIIQESLTRQ